MQRESVSVIIPTHNSALTLHACLQSLSRQSYPGHELIIVDSFSGDSTLNIAKEFHAKVIMSKALPSSKRNIGVAGSSSAYILFLDSDEILTDNTIEKCVNLCAKGSDFVCFDFSFVGKGFWSSCSALLRSVLGSELNKIGETHPVPRFFKREALLSVGLYNDGLLLGEDWDLYQRAKKETKEASFRPKVYHIEPSSIKEMIIKEVRYGLSNIKLKPLGVLPWNRLALIFTAKEIMFNTSYSHRSRLGALFLLILRSIGRAIGETLSSVTEDDWPSRDYE